MKIPRRLFQTFIQGLFTTLLLFFGGYLALPLMSFSETETYIPTFSQWIGLIVFILIIIPLSFYIGIAGGRKITNLLFNDSQ
jgi:hypothetical protein